MTDVSDNPSGLATIESPDHAPGIPFALLTQTFTYAVGTGMFMAGSSLFFTRYVGLMSTQVGLGLSVAFCLSFLLKMPLGVLSDRLGGRNSWRLAAGIQALTFGLYPLVHSYSVFQIVTVIEIVASSLGTISRQKYFGDLFGDADRARYGARLRSTMNLGLAVGTVGAGLAVGVDSRWSYVLLVWINAGTYLLDVALITWAMPGIPAADQMRGPGRWMTAQALRDRPFLTLSLVTGIFIAYGPILMVTLPLWVLKRTDAPHITVTVGLLLNMAIVAVFQTAASRRTMDFAGTLRTQRRAGHALAVACVAFAASAFTHAWLTLVVLAIGVIALSLGELLVSATTWVIGYRLAPAQRRGEYLAVYGLGGGLAWMLAPGAATALVLDNGSAGWLGVGLAFALGSAVSTPVSLRAARHLDKDAAPS
jgi:MFS family permease